MLDTATRILRSISILLRYDIYLAAVVTMFYSLRNGPLLHNIPHTGKLRIVTCNHVILSQVNLPGTIFSSQIFEIQSRLDTKHQVREDRGLAGQMQQLSWRPWRPVWEPLM